MSAQLTTDIPYGTVVRYSSHSRVGPIQAVVDHTEPGAIILTIAGTHDPIRVPMADLTGLEIRRRTTAAKPAMVVGAVIGAGVGVQLAAHIPPSPCSELVCFDSEKMMESALYVGIGIGVGAAVGAIVGSQFKHDRWLPVDLGVVQPTPGAGPGGLVTAGISIHF